MSEEQVQQMMQTWRDTLAKQMDELRIRQWCVEQAIKSFEAGHDSDVVGLAERILKFITAPFAETFKE